MFRSAFVFSLLALGLVATVEGRQEGLIPHAQDRPPNPAKTPAEAIAAMTVPEGFQVELVAAEPMIVNPVAMTFDEKGRIWITESLEYPRREPGVGRDRVKVLEDTDGDGAADKTWIFLEGLNIPSGVAVGHGGVWVANSPDILFVPDADRDGKADGPAEVVATGFGRDDTHELPSALTWGPDGWLYGWNGVFNPSRVKSNNGRTYDFTCAIWRIHPRTREFQVWSEGTSNPWGIATNEAGEFFASACVIDHLWHMVESAYYIRQGGPYPPHTWPMRSIVDYKHQKAAYCGITWVDSDTFPEAFNRRLYMGNIHGNCVNVDAIEKAGATYRGKGEPDFLSANDAWFMPVVQKVGPDGSLYVLDWYDRYHCYQDANRDPAGIDRLKGRLYRVRYTGAPARPRAGDLGAAADAELVALLGSGNVQIRETAQRVLTERLAAGRAEAATKAALEAAVLDEAGAMQRRRHALWTLIGSGPLGTEFHEKVLAVGDPTLRAWGVRTAGNQGKVAPSIATKVAALAADKAPEVRLQAAIAAKKVEGLDAVAVLAEAASAGEDPLVAHVVWQNLHPLLDEKGAAFAERVAARDGELPGSLDAIVPRAVERLLSARRFQPEVLTSILKRLAGADEDELVQAILVGLTDRIHDGALGADQVVALRETMEPVVGPILQSVDATKPESMPRIVDLTLLVTSWTDPKQVNAFTKLLAGTFVSGQQMVDDDRRVRALNTLVRLGDADTALAAVKVAITDPAAKASADLKGRLVASLGRLDRPEVAATVLELFPALDPGLKGRAVELLTQRPTWTKALVGALESKVVPTTTLNVNQIRRLQAATDPEVAEFVKRTFGTVRTGRNEQRELVVGQMANYLAKTPGDAVAGRKVFDRLCAQCHKIYGEGQEVGPDVTLNGRNDFAQLLSNVFDPNLVIGPAYQATIVATSDGRVLTGLLAEDSPEQVVLKLQGGKVETIPRGQVDEVQVSKVSLMPEDLEKQMTPQEIADLFSFLALDKPPGDPTAKRLSGAPAPASR